MLVNANYIKDDHRWLCSTERFCCNKPWDPLDDECIITLHDQAIGGKGKGANRLADIILITLQPSEIEEADKALLLRTSVDE